MRKIALVGTGSLAVRIANELLSKKIDVHIVGNLHQADKPEFDKVIEIVSESEINEYKEDNPCQLKCPMITIVEYKKDSPVKKGYTFLVRNRLVMLDERNYYSIFTYQPNLKLLIEIIMNGHSSFELGKICYMRGSSLSVISKLEIDDDSLNSKNSNKVIYLDIENPYIYTDLRCCNWEDYKVITNNTLPFSKAVVLINLNKLKTQEGLAELNSKLGSSFYEHKQIILLVVGEDTLGKTIQNLNIFQDLVQNITTNIRNVILVTSQIYQHVDEELATTILSAYNNNYKKLLIYNSGMLVEFEGNSIGNYFIIDSNKVILGGGNNSATIHNI